jgi:hypothetical protein
MRRFLIVPIAFVALLAVPAAVRAGGGDGFDGVVRSIESRYDVRVTRIPFMGLMSLIAQKATHDGARGVHVAEIEFFSGEVDGEELNRMVEEKLGSGWERIIRETSRRGNEQTLIFMRPEGERMGLFVIDLSGKEMDVVEVSVDSRHMNESIGRYQKHQHNRDHDQEQSD